MAAPKPFRVVVAEPGKPAKERDIDGSLEAFQALVGGDIEAVPAGPLAPLDVFVNEDGRLRSLPPNRTLGGFRLLGTIVVSAHDDEGETVSLTDAEARRAIDVLNTPF